MTVKTYDPACYDLAAHFLEDEPCRNDKDLFNTHCHSLALEIQQAIEDWFFMPDDTPVVSRPHQSTPTGETNGSA